MHYPRRKSFFRYVQNRYRYLHVSTKDRHGQFYGSDPDPRSDAFVTPGSRIRDGLKYLNSLMRTQIRDPGILLTLGSGMEKIRTRDKHPESTTLSGTGYGIPVPHKAREDERE